MTETKLLGSLECRYESECLSFLYKNFQTSSLFPEFSSSLLLESLRPGFSLIILYKYLTFNFLSFLSFLWQLHVFSVFWILFEIFLCFCFISHCLCPKWLIFFFIFLYYFNELLEGEKIYLCSQLTVYQHLCVDLLKLDSSFDKNL